MRSDPHTQPTGWCRLFHSSWRVGCNWVGDCLHPHFPFGALYIWVKTEYRSSCLSLFVRLCFWNFGSMFYSYIIYIQLPSYQIFEPIYICNVINNIYMAYSQNIHRWFIVTWLLLFVKMWLWLYFIFILSVSNNTYFIYKYWHPPRTFILNNTTRNKRVH